MKVRISRRAEADIEAIGDWIAERNLARAESFADELLDRCRSLADYPERFPVALKTARATLRKVPHGDYLIFYVIGPSHIEVLRIVHGARDWLPLFES